MSLKLDWCDYKSAKWAVEKWHYSHAMPSGKLTRIGVWEDGKFIGVVLFGRGANAQMLMPYGLDMTEGCELVRIALRDHKAPVSKIVSIAIKMLVKLSPDLRLIISYADTRQGHIGAIYQAGNWIYTGLAKATPQYLWKGRYVHQRSIGSYIKSGLLTWEQATKLPQNPPSDKYRYLMPLDDKMREQVEKLRKPYPKRQKHKSNASAVQAEKGGAIPTLTLQ